MTAVEVETGELVDVLSEADARDLTERLRGSLDVSWGLVVEALNGCVWLPMGYENWDAYCAGEFDTGHLRLPRAERQEVVGSLRDAGFTIREIASATGVSPGTVHSDLAAFNSEHDDPGDDPEPPAEDPPPPSNPEAKKARKRQAISTSFDWLERNPDQLDSDDLDDLAAVSARINRFVQKERRRREPVNHRMKGVR